MPLMIKVILTTFVLAGGLGWIFRLGETAFGLLASGVLLGSLLLYSAQDEGYLHWPSRQRKPQPPPAPKR